MLPYRGIQWRRNAAAAATAPLKAGGSLFNTNIHEIFKQINTERNVTIQLNNYSHKYILKNPRFVGISIRSEVMDPITIATSATAIIAGASLVGTSVGQISGNMDTWRNATIQIINHSETSILANPRTNTTSGYCFLPPQPTIAKRTKEACSFSKTPHTARGSVGVLIYQILRNGTDNVGELAIMFSVPYDYNHYENMFALGIYQPNISCDDDLFNKMYYSNGPFTRGKGSGSVIEYSGKQAVVKGTMSAFGQSVIKVEFWDK